MTSMGTNDLSFFEVIDPAFSHSTRLRLAHGRPFAQRKCDFSPRSASNALSKHKARRMGRVDLTKAYLVDLETEALICDPQR
jgi:hypothetical protein